MMVLYLMDNIGSKVMPIVNLGISLHFSLDFPCTSNGDWLALPHVGTGLFYLNISQLHLQFWLPVINYLKHNPAIFPPKNILSKI